MGNFEDWNNFILKFTIFSFTKTWLVVSKSNIHLLYLDVFSKMDFIELRLFDGTESLFSLKVWNFFDSNFNVEYIETFKLIHVISQTLFSVSFILLSRSFSFDRFINVFIQVLMLFNLIKVIFFCSICKNIKPAISRSNFSDKTFLRVYSSKSYVNEYYTESYGFIRRKVSLKFNYWI